MKKIIIAICATAMALALVSCGKSKNTTTYDPAKNGIQGSWVADGENGTSVSTFLAMYFNVVKITAEFRSNNTYLVKSWDNTGVITTYEGVYTAVKSGNGNIWSITLDQSTPSAVTSEGIFEVTKEGDSYKMNYEVVQTNPPAGTAPTAEGGFGSSGGGAYGTALVQTYIRVNG